MSFYDPTLHRAAAGLAPLGLGPRDHQISRTHSLHDRHGAATVARGSDLRIEHVMSMKPRFTFDPREVDGYVSKLDPRRELVYRLAIRGLCNRCRGDRAFQDRTSTLMLKFGSELDAVLREAGELKQELTKEKPRQ